MKRAFYITITMLLLAVLHATANAQDTQEPPSDPCEAKSKQGCVTVDYDKFQDKTFVTMTPIFLTIPTVNWTDYPFARLAVGVTYSSPGSTIKRSDTVTLLFVSVRLDDVADRQQAFEDSKVVYLLIDGKSHPLGDVTQEKHDREFYVSKWVYSLNVPFETIELIATGKSVEIRAGSVETTIDEKVKAPFRRLVELVPKKESTAPAKAAQRPKPARTPRRRRRP